MAYVNNMQMKKLAREANGTDISVVSMHDKIIISCDDTSDAYKISNFVSKSRITVNDIMNEIQILEKKLKELQKNMLNGNATKWAAAYDETKGLIEYLKGLKLKY